MLLLINGLYCIIMATLDEMISFLDTASFLVNPFAIFKAQKEKSATGRGDTVCYKEFLATKCVVYCFLMLDITLL